MSEAWNSPAEVLRRKAEALRGSACGSRKSADDLDFHAADLRRRADDAEAEAVELEGAMEALAMVDRIRKSPAERINEFRRSQSLRDEAASE